MERRQFLQRALTLSIAGGALLSGCGGGGSTGDRSVRGHIEAPTGQSAQGWRVASGAQESVAGAQGAFQAALAGDAPTMALVRDTDGRAVFLGFLDPAGETHLGAASTAVALLYFALGGWMLPADRKRDTLRLIGEHAATAPLVARLRTDSAVAGFNLESPPAGLAAAVKAATEAIVGGAARGRSSGRTRQTGAPTLMSVTPTGEQSGVEVVQSTAPDSLLAINHFHRRAEVRVYRTATTDDAGARTTLSPVVAEGTPVPLPSTGALGIFSTLLALRSGQTAFAPITSPPIPVSLAPGSARTDFEVVVLNASTVLFEPAFFSEPRYAAQAPLWRLARTRMNVVTFLADVLFGLLLELWGLRDIARNDAAITAAVDAFLAIEDQSVQALVQAAGRGDLLASAAGLIHLAVNSDTISGKVRVALEPLIPVAEREILRQQNQSFLKIVGKALLAMLNVAGSILGVGDLAAVLLDLAHSEPAERWQVGLVRTDVRISPATTTLHPGDSTTFTALFPGAAGKTLRYKWSVAAPFAVLTDTTSGQSGRSFETTSNHVQLATTPSDRSAVTVSVEVIGVDTDGNRTSLGTATANVTMKEDDDPVPFGSVRLTLSGGPGGDIDSTPVRILARVRAQHVPATETSNRPIYIESVHELIDPGGTRDADLVMLLNFGDQMKAGQSIDVSVTTRAPLALRLATPTGGGPSVRFFPSGGALKILSVTGDGDPVARHVRFKGSFAMYAQDDPSVTMNATLDGWITDIRRIGEPLT